MQTNAPTYTASIYTGDQNSKYNFNVSLNFHFVFISFSSLTVMQMLKIKKFFYIDIVRFIPKLSGCNDDSMIISHKEIPFTILKLLCYNHKLRVECEEFTPVMVSSYIL